MNQLMNQLMNKLMKRSIVIQQVGMIQINLMKLLTIAALIIKIK